MSWKYGILRERSGRGEARFFYLIYEFYTNRNSIDYTSCTKDAVAAHGETVEEVQADLRRMLKDCDGPVYEEVDGELREMEE